jgi:hypothetical protein
MNGQLHAPAVLPAGKELSVAIGQDAGWTGRYKYKMLGIPFKRHYLLKICTVHYTTFDSHNRNLIPINE